MENKMVREPNKNHGVCKLRFSFKKHQMTNLGNIYHQPYLINES